MSAPEAGWQQQAAPVMPEGASPNGSGGPTWDGMTLEQLGRENKRLREALTGPWPYQVEEAVRRRYWDLWEEREARQRVIAREYAEACGERRIMSWDEFAAQPPPEWIHDRLLTKGFHGLAGPPGAGKSLLCRDWLLEVAASGRNVLYAPTEGQFDMATRFEAHPLYAKGKPHLAILPEDAALSLASREDVAWLAGQMAANGVVLAVFDMIYDRGVTDDNTVQGVAPVYGGCRRLINGTGAAVLVTGHPGLNGQRRFRGTSAWRGWFDSEYHLADGEFTCEKHKYADPKKIAWAYRVEYPYLRRLDMFEGGGREAHRQSVIISDLEAYPDESDAARAKRLAGQLGLTVDYVRKLVKAVRKMQE